MKNKIIIFIIVPVSLYVVIFWYYYPRSVESELVIEIPKPDTRFDNSQWASFFYISNKKTFTYCMIDWWRSKCDSLKWYDNQYIDYISTQLDYEKYDYLILYQKKLKSLNYSPYLTKTEDGLYFDQRTPLIPTFDTLITDKVYIYQIEKNNKFRAPGP